MVISSSFQKGDLFHIAGFDAIFIPNFSHHN